MKSDAASDGSCLLGLDGGLLGLLPQLLGFMSLETQRASALTSNEQGGKAHKQQGSDRATSVCLRAADFVAVAVVGGRCPCSPVNLGKSQGPAREQPPLLAEAPWL